MKKNKKILTFIISVIAFFFLVLFPSIINLISGEEVKYVEFIKNNIGIKEINISDKGLILKEVKEDQLKDLKDLKDKNFIDSFSYNNDLYFQISKNTDYKKTLDKKSITLGKGLFLFNIRDSRPDYNIQGTGYNISPLSQGIFFVDSRDIKNIHIFSFNSLLNTKLINIQTKKTVSELYIYPHISFKFNIGRNSVLKNSDILRLSEVFSIRYIKESLLNPDFTINNNFLKILLQKKDNNIDSFIKKTFSIILSEKNKALKKTNEIKENGVKEIGGFSFINKYFSLFLNNEKKNIYYKNSVIRDLNSLFLGEKSLKDIENNIKDNLDKLKNISEDSYNELVDLVKKYYKLITIKSDINNIKLEKDFYNLIKFLNGEKYEAEIPSSLYLSLIYSLKNNTDIGKGFYKNLNIYTNLFLKELKITDFISYKKLKIVNRKKIGEINIKLDYFSSILTKLLKSSFYINEENGETINVLDKYILINEILNIEKKSSIKTLTILNNYSEIFSLTLSELQNLYFEKNRNLKGLLVIKNDNGLSDENLKKLLSIIKKIKDFYTANKKTLNINNTKQKNIISNIDKSINLSKDLILAINNYDTYLSLKDPIRNNLIKGNALVIKKDNSLSREKAIKYINQFNDIDTSIMRVKVLNNKYIYQNIKIGTKKISFDISPLSKNTMTNIYIGDQKSNSIYTLDELKKVWDKEIKNKQEEERKKYDFKNFLTNTFDKGKKEEKTETVKKQEEKEETPIIRIFKKNKLLGEEGDFNIVKDFINILYDNITVELLNDSYKIFIKGAKINRSLKINNTDRKFSVEVDFDYDFEKHLFKNLVFTFFSPNSGDRKIKLLGGNNIKIVTPIYLSTFKTKINGLLLNFYQIDSFQNQIKKINLINKEIEIQYSALSSQIKFIFKINNENIELTFDKTGKLIRLIKGNKIISSKDLNINNITNYFNN